MEERRCVGEDMIEEEKDAWEVVEETEWGTRDRRWSEVTSLLSRTWEDWRDLP